ncbi:MAG: hypothetical protein JO337_03665, partial [Acidimicrobiales bacterium]|nr:hypothetical protein [Acidimicrobiales bacterium]
QAAEAAAERASAALSTFEKLDLRRQEHEALVAEGRAARQQLDEAEQGAARFETELSELARLEATLEALERQASGLADHERELDLLRAAAGAASSVEALAVPPRPPDIDETALEEAMEAARTRREELAATTALLGAAEAELGRARQAAERSASLDGEAECPICGQALGAAFATVQAHRAAEVTDAEGRLKTLQGELRQVTSAARAADSGLAELTARVGAERRRLAEWEQAQGRRLDAERALAARWAEVCDAGVRLGGPTQPSGPPPAAALAAAAESVQRELTAQRAAGQAVLRIRGRLETRAQLERAWADSRERAGDAGGRVEALREKVRALGFTPADLEAAIQRRNATAAASRAAGATAHEAALTVAREEERARGAKRRWEEGRAQHAKLAELESEARHRSRVADLLAEFRNTVVASVGPRLATQAAELFGELTDHEYERIEVDPDTYQLQICDGGLLYGLDRFSGSEIDLANLALRVAISEHIHFQSGGSVGLLVLDEVFGPLDEDRKTRMLLALERLRGRFRQILVVTHDAEIKEQLPNAIEVVKRPGRRATAQVLD